MMIHREYSARIHCIHTHSNPYAWAIHPSDVREEAFVTYFGFNNKAKADRFISKELRQNHPEITIEIRPSKHFKAYKYELKVWGLPWAFVRNQIADEISVNLEIEEIVATV